MEFRESWPEDDPPPLSRRGPEAAGEFGRGELWPGDDGAARRDEMADALGRTAVRDTVVQPEAGDLGRIALRGAELDDRTGGAADVRDVPRVPDVPDLDLDTLRRADASLDRFSDAHVCWVPLDRVESTAAVRGEPMDGDRDAYTAMLADACEAHEAGREPQLDARLTGWDRIRLCENPDTGVLEVTGGRHRIEEAREAGIPAVVAEVRVLREEWLRGH